MYNCLNLHFSIAIYYLDWTYLWVLSALKSIYKKTNFLHMFYSFIIEFFGILKHSVYGFITDRYSTPESQILWALQGLCKGVWPPLSCFWELYRYGHRLTGHMKVMRLLEILHPTFIPAKAILAWGNYVSFCWILNYNSFWSPMVLSAVVGAEVDFSLIQVRRTMSSL